MEFDCILIQKHPTLDVYCFSDGSILRPQSGVHGPSHTFGTDVNGYRVMKIKGKPYPVHRLIAEAFIPNPENKPTVDHVNRLKDDNRVVNLRWATAKEQADNRDFVISSMQRNALGVRSCDNLYEYTKRRRQYVREHGHGLEKHPVFEDEAHQKQRERCARYREKHREEIAKRNHEAYLRRIAC